MHANNQPHTIAQLLSNATQSSPLTSQSASLAQRPTSTSPAIIEIYDRWPTPTALLTAFNPDLQSRYCADIQRAYFGRAPQLVNVAKAHGRPIAESWLELQLKDLSEYAGVRDKITLHQLTNLAASVYNEYAYFKLSEFMLFFQRFKLGYYGRFYGAVDPIRISEALLEFKAERFQAYAVEDSRREREAREQRRTEGDECRARYVQRIPDAFTPAAPLSYTQYSLMGFDYLSDEELAARLQAITDGTEKLPTDITSILETIRNAV